MAMYLTLKHLKYCLDTCKVDTETMLRFESFILTYFQIVH